MLKKGWEVLALVVILVITGHLVMAALQPFLPVLGIISLIVITAAIVRLVYFRKWFW